MKKMAILAALLAKQWANPHALRSLGYQGYSYPVSSNHHTGKAAERRAAKRRRKAK